MYQTLERRCEPVNFGWGYILYGPASNKFSCPVSESSCIMPGLINTRLELPKFTPPPDTTASLDWAPLTIIDLSRFDAPGGKEKLAKELGDAVKRWGFWVVTSTGISQNQVDRQLDIGNAFFKQPLEEKRKVACDFSVGK